MSGEAIWLQALDAAKLFAVDPVHFGGMVVRAGPGPVRDRYMDHLAALLGTRGRRLPLNVDEDRLFGGLDLVATLRAGKPVYETGILANVEDRILVAPMAERLAPATLSALANSLDRGMMRIERDGLSETVSTEFALIAWDEGKDETEIVSAKLADRLAFLISLTDVAQRDALEPETIPKPEQIQSARISLKATHVNAPIAKALCTAASKLGIASMRAPIMALHAARISAALSGRQQVNEDDASRAAQLVLAPRATALPSAEPPEEEPDTSESPEMDEEQALGDQALEDMIIEATLAVLPPDLLAKLEAGMSAGIRRAHTGRSGEKRRAKERGRPIGSRRSIPRSGERIAIVETLRAAAPWQRLRRSEQSSGVTVHAEDLRVRRFQHRTESTTIFLVDASGSTALNRLAEAKAAVELLLADCYVRREQVALIAFRRTTAELILPPTRSLVRAKRELAALPGGGATPLATGLQAGFELALSVRHHGQTPFLVLLTDGRPNVDNKGIGGRSRAAEDATKIARIIEHHGVTSLVIDTSQRPEPFAREIAAHMGARYEPLPRANADQLNRVIRNAGPNAMAA